MNETIAKVELRRLQFSDYKELRASMIEAYSNWPGIQWEEPEIEKLIHVFPEGQIGAAVNNVIVGCALSIIVDYDQFGDQHTYNQITGNDTFNTHDPEGDVLYGIDVFIRPEFRQMRLGRRLYDARKEICEQLNLRGIIFGGRIPNYHKFADELSPKQYIDQVRHKEIFDPVLTFQLSNDFQPRRIIKNYLKGDEESREYAVLLEWSNIYYEPPSNKLQPVSSVVRLGLVQWQMRRYATLDDVMEQAEFFVDAVSDYKSDFILFPEFFNAPLMAGFNHMPESEAIRQLAYFTETLRDKFLQLAISYNINIITGSMPLLEGNKLYNVGYLCRRDGSFERYVKLHVTPDEERCWGMSGGEFIQVFDTDCGKIGVLICYDVEFPELGRILADQGMRILFVPFLTDTQNGYSRVRHCAQARAIENECYVAMAGSVGNLPKVNNMDIQYAQSAIFTPCDFAFPTEGLKAEATPNTEMILIGDIDLDLLKELHTYGSVRNLKDRRKDIYTVKLMNRNGNRSYN